uniref:Uncharacterized protein n=1 Tax=Streptomyces sp. FR1 TaxID=349971 RepID=V9Z3U4_9ACTN|nr:hypothetical protein pFRL3_425 [Streptomyces sp. FR1]
MTNDYAHAASLPAEPADTSAPLNFEDPRTVSAGRPALHARYRLEWRYRGRPEQDMKQGEFK